MLDSRKTSRYPSLDSAASSVNPQPNESTRRLLRFGLFLTHFVVLGAVVLSAPREDMYRLGAKTGPILIVTCVFLWAMLCLARSQRIIMLFCALAIVQTASMEYVVAGFRATDKAVRHAVAGLGQHRNEMQSRMAQFSLDPLFEMCSGQRELRREELAQLHSRARDAQTEIQEQKQQSARWEAEAEAQIAAADPAAARDFRRGLEDGRPAADEIVKLAQTFYSDAEKLVELLLARQRKLSVTANGIVFQREEDALSFNEQMASLQNVARELDAHNEKAEKDFRDTSAGQ